MSGLRRLPDDGGPAEAAAGLPAVEPARSPYATQLAGAGIVEPETENISLGTHLPGVVERCSSRSAQTVKAGDPLFRSTTGSCGPTSASARRPSPTPRRSSTSWCSCRGPRNCRRSRRRSPRRRRAGPESSWRGSSGSRTCRDQLRLGRRDPAAAVGVRGRQGPGRQGQGRPRPARRGHLEVRPQGRRGGRRRPGPARSPGRPERHDHEGPGRRGPRAPAELQGAAGQRPPRRVRRPVAGPGADRPGRRRQAARPRRHRRERHPPLPNRHAGVAKPRGNPKDEFPLDLRPRRALRHPEAVADRRQHRAGRHPRAAGHLRHRHRRQAPLRRPANGRVPRGPHRRRHPFPRRRSPPPTGTNGPGNRGPNAGSAPRIASAADRHQTPAIGGAVAGRR